MLYLETKVKRTNYVKCIDYLPKTENSLYYEEGLQYMFDVGDVIPGYEFTDLLHAHLVKEKDRYIVKVSTPHAPYLLAEEELGYIERNEDADIAYDRMIYARVSVEGGKYKKIVEYNGTKYASKDSKDYKFTIRIYFN